MIAAMTRMKYDRRMTLLLSYYKHKSSGTPFTDIGRFESNYTTFFVINNVIKSMIRDTMDEKRSVRQLGQNFGQ